MVMVEEDLAKMVIENRVSKSMKKKKYVQTEL